MHALKNIALIVAIAAGVITAGIAISSIAYTGRPHTGHGFWFFFLVALGAGSCWSAAYVGDCLLAGQQRLAGMLEDQRLHIEDYGDKREASGHQTAMRVTRHQTRHLGTVD